MSNLIKIISYDNGKTNPIISENELIQWNNTLLNNNDNMIIFNILLYPENKQLYNNPKIEFFINESTLNIYKCKYKDNYLHELFNYVRSIFLENYN